MKNDNILTEDSFRDFETQIQEITDKYVKQAEAASAEKEAEVMTV